MPNVGNKKIPTTRHPVVNTLTILRAQKLKSKRIMDLQNYNYEQIYFYSTMEHGFSYIRTSAGTGSINKK